MFNITFKSVRELTDWLNMHRKNCSSPEEYDAWLQSIFENGDTVSVRDEEYDYAALQELV